MTGATTQRRYANSKVSESPEQLDKGYGGCKVCSLTDMIKDGSADNQTRKLSWGGSGSHVQ